MRKSLVLFSTAALVLAGLSPATANEVVCSPPLVPTNGGCDSPPIQRPDYSNTPRQYADAGNGLVVELPLFAPDGSPYIHGVTPLPMAPNPRTLAELGLDSSTPLQTLSDDTIIPLARPMPSSYADQKLWPFGYDSNGSPVPAPLYNPDGSPYVHGVSPLPYVPTALPEYLPLPPRFTAADFKKLTPQQISNMQTGDFAQLPAEVLRSMTDNQAMLLRGPQIATFSASDATALTPEAVAAMVPSEFKAIQVKAFAAFKPDVIDELTVEHLDALTTKHFASLKAAQVAKLDADQVEGLDPQDVKALSPNVVSKLRPKLLASMDDAQLEAFKSNQLKKITKAQKKALSAKQLKVLAD